MVHRCIVSILVLCSSVALADEEPPVPPPPVAAAAQNESHVGVEVAAVGAVIGVAPSTKVGPGGGGEVQVFTEDSSGRALGADAMFTVHTSTIGTVYAAGLGIERRYGSPGGGFYWGFRVSATYLWSGDSSARGVEPGFFVGVREANADFATGLMVAIGSYHAGSVCSGYCDGAFAGFVLALRAGFSFAD